MDVGINYPWYNCGWDFGEAPPNWRTRPDPNWVYEIDNDLAEFQGLGLTVVRWFIVANGLSYGTDTKAPHLDPNSPGQWRFDDPPQLDQSFKDHFRLLLKKFETFNQTSQANIRLMPVLIDFQFCLPGKQAEAGWFTGGRSDVIQDPWKQGRFFDRVLDPLLEISGEYRSIIFAWDIINEPEWVTDGWHPEGKRNLPVSEPKMRDFLNEAMRRVHASNLKATIGFNKINTIKRTNIFADFNQFHYYPDGKSDLQLGKHDFDTRWPGIIGEFAASTKENTRWPELPDDQEIIDRLQHAEKMGYPLALLWSRYATPGPNDPHTAWNPQVKQDIQCFTQQCEWECWLKKPSRAVDVKLYSGGIIGVFQTQEEAEAEKGVDRAWEKAGRWECWLKKSTQAIRVKLYSGGIIGVFKTKAQAQTEKEPGSGKVWGKSIAG